MTTIKELESQTNKRVMFEFMNSCHPLYRELKNALPFGHFVLDNGVLTLPYDPYTMITAYPDDIISLDGDFTLEQLTIIIKVVKHVRNKFNKAMKS